MSKIESWVKALEVKWNSPCEGWRQNTYYYNNIRDIKDIGDEKFNGKEDNF